MADYRILVTGSREFNDYAAVCWELGAVLRKLIAAGPPRPRIVVVHGAARGADALAERAARSLGMDTEPHPADWTQGKGAGLRRNADMVSLGADCCIALYKQGAGNKGTDHCAKLAEAAGIPTRRVTAMTMRCNLCPDTSPFTVPCGDGIGEALMAAHLESEHGESGPARRLAGHGARTVRPRGPFDYRGGPFDYQGGESTP